MGGPIKRPSLSGNSGRDTTIGHGTAYCHLLEALTDTEPPLRGQVLRSIALELEGWLTILGIWGPFPVM